ncbi:MAG: hypothetical protein ABSE95_00585 [Thermodesulfobacteriota bacterium]
MPRQVGDIASALAYQVKKEIAENFFGTRKILEEERNDLIQQEIKLEKAGQQEVLPILIRILQLFIGEEEGQSFLNLLQREDLIESVKQAIKDQVINPSPILSDFPFAFTAKGKYKNLIFALYHMAKANIDELLKEFNVLQKQAILFNEDLTKFKSSYSLSDILSLIKSIEGADGLKGVLGENTDPRSVPLLEEKLLLRPLDFSREKMPILRPLPSVTDIEEPLNRFIDQTFQNHGSEIKKALRDKLS